MSKQRPVAVTTGCADPALDQRIAALRDEVSQRRAEERRLHGIARETGTRTDADAAAQAGLRLGQAQEQLAAAIKARDAQATEHRREAAVQRLRDKGQRDTEPPRPTNQGSGGGGMSVVDEGRAGIAAMAESANQGVGALQQGQQALEQAQGQLMQTTQNSGRADADQAAGMLTQAIDSAAEAVQQALAAVSSAEDWAAQL